MPIHSDHIKEKLNAQFGDGIISWDASSDILTLEVVPSINLKVLTFLYDEPTLGFQFLTDLTGVHYPDQPGKEIGVVYHLHNLKENARLRMKIFVPIEKSDVFTASGLFSGANWMERETFDFYGIHFIGHPNLKRVLNVDEMDYHPLRKEYPLEDQTRIDKDDEMFGR